MARHTKKQTNRRNLSATTEGLAAILETMLRSADFELTVIEEKAVKNVLANLDILTESLKFD